jgi:diadenosine tetraphosphate (Ap4A) HIT family hydrolase
MGGVIPLADGIWIVNQYAGPEGFLGWLALQPRCHRMEFGELSDRELAAFGPIVKNLDSLLVRYWRETFYPEDEVKRVHLVYFFESVFDEPPTDFHMHFHVIPRTIKTGRLLRVYPKRSTEPCCPSDLNAWMTPDITASEFFPPEYRRTADRVNRLMTWLKAHIEAA